MKSQQTSFLYVSPTILSDSNFALSITSEVKNNFIGFNVINSTWFYVSCLLIYITKHKI